MLCHVRMDVRPPPHCIDPAAFGRQEAREDRARDADIAVFDVESYDERHAILSSLPSTLGMSVTPLARHPPAVR